MTREEREFAKSRIEYLLLADNCLDKHDREALEMAIQALSQEPTDRIEYGTDGNAYKLWISNGKDVLHRR